MKTDLLAASGALRRITLTNPKSEIINPKSPPTMFFLARATVALIHRAALTIAVINGILTGFFAGLLTDPAIASGLLLCCFAAACLWTLIALTIALRTRLHHDSYLSFRDARGLTTDAIGDHRCPADDGTASRL